MCQHGVLHRDNGLPAVIFNKTKKKWYQYGKLHRDGDLPAETNSLLKRYYKHGVLHRDNDRPAVVYYYDHCEWWNNEIFQYKKKISIHQMML